MAIFVDPNIFAGSVVASHGDLSLDSQLELFQSAFELASKHNHDIQDKSPKMTKADLARERQTLHDLGL